MVTNTETVLVDAVTAFAHVAGERRLAVLIKNFANVSRIYFSVTGRSVQRQLMVSDGSPFGSPGYIRCEPLTLNGWFMGMALSPL